MKNKQLTNTYTRFAQLELKQNGILDAKERRVQLSFSSDTPYQRNDWFDGSWIEILGHDPHEANISRFNNGAPLLRNHNEGIGVVEKAWLENGKGNAIVRLSKRTALDDMWKDIEDGIISNVSVGYRIKEKQLIKAGVNSPDEYRVTSWEGLEISILDVPPADATVGIGRSDEAFFKRYEEQNMDVKPQESGATIETPPIATGDQSQRTMTDEAAIRTRVLAEQAQRNEQIKALFAIMKNHNGLGDLKERCLADPNITLEQTQQMLLTELGNRSVYIDNTRADIQAGETDQEKFAKGVESSILGRTALGQYDPHNEWNNRSLIQIAEHSIQLRGERINSYSPREILNQALSQRSGAMSSSDLPIIFSNIANKSMQQGFDVLEEVYPFLTTKGSLPNFLTHQMISIGTVGRLLRVDHQGERKTTYAIDGKEEWRLGTFARKLKFSREMMVNNQYDAITIMLNDLGQAAKRTIGIELIDYLRSNPLMADGKALFSADHKNLATTGAAVSFDTLKAAKLAMSTQKGLGGDTTLNIVGSIIFCSKSQEDDVARLIGTPTDPSSNNAGTLNPYYNKYKVYADPRLDELDDNSWYMLGDPSRYRTLVIGYLNGNENPTLESNVGYSLDGIEYEILLDFGIKAPSPAPLYKNPGA